MEWIAYILFLFTAVRLTVSAYNYFSRPYLPASGISKGKVSVLVPARNEQTNIGNLLDDLHDVPYSPLEILVYDDESTDDTAGMVRHHMKADTRIVLMRGMGPEKGWLGKNYACDRLGEAAGGQWFLFLDADVRVNPNTVAKAVKYMDMYGLNLLSVFPSQIIPSAGSRVSVPLMNWILLSLLPLKLVRDSARPALSASNGQFMLFDAESYRSLRPHSRFRNSGTEDIAIGRHYKKNGLRTATLLGGEDVQCLMYRHLAEAVRGFSKNIFQFFGGSPAVGFLFAFLTTAAPFLLFLWAGTLWGWLYLGMIAAIRLFVSLASGQSFWGNLLLAIPQQAILWVIMVNALVTGKKRNLKWKGRNIYSDC